MLSRLSTAVGLALVSFSASAAAVTCGECSPTMFFDNFNRTLVLQRVEEGNAVQCDYSSQGLTNVIPYCLYRNIDGVLLITNTGPTITSLPGACPAIKLVQMPSCPVLSG
ncbi:hypothetical protein FB451DRAFT_1206970 [Mycena latifolia]|nr:hypothetical protein FB451DRAFT_1206970 [Mycena latifolia]